MKAQRWALGVTGINLAILALALGSGLPWAVANTPQASPASTAEVVPVLRGRSFELVDEHRQIRSRMNIEADGAVVLRLMDRSGTIRVKLGADEGGSGLVLLDEATEPGVHIIARQVGTSARPNTTSLTLRGAGAREQVIRP